MAGFQFASKREKGMEMGGGCWKEMEMSPCKRNRSITYRSHAIGTVGALKPSGKNVANAGEGVALHHPRWSVLRGKRAVIEALSNLCKKVNRSEGIQKNRLGRV